MLVGARFPLPGIPFVRTPCFDSNFFGISQTLHHTNVVTHEAKAFLHSSSVLRDNPPKSLDLPDIDDLTFEESKNNGGAVGSSGPHKEGVDAINKTFQRQPSPMVENGGLQKGRFDETMHHPQQKGQVDNANVHSYLQMGIGFESQENWNDALRSFESAIQTYQREMETSKEASKDQRSPYRDALCGKARALSKLKKFTKALNAYDFAISRYPKDAEPLLGRATVLSAVGRFDEEMETYEQILTMFPKHLKTLKAKGMAHLRIKQYAKAIVLFNKFLEKEQEVTDKRMLAQVYNAKGEALQGVKRSREALACYEMALKAESKYISAMINKATALSKLRRNIAAVETWCKMVDTETTCKEDWEAKSSFIDMLSMKEYINDQYFAGLDNKGLLFAVDALLIKALCMMISNQFSLVIKYCRDILYVTEQQHVDAWFHMSRAQLRQGDPQKAVDGLMRVFSSAVPPEVQEQYAEQWQKEEHSELLLDLVEIARVAQDRTN